ncbi:MAG: cupredoxin domain-containing protein [Halobacteriota archaeon]
MNSRKRMLILLITFTIIASTCAAGCMTSHKNETNATTKAANKTVSANATKRTTTGPMRAPATPTPMSAQKSTTAAVAIQNFAFNPSAITVVRGTTVIWTNQQPGVPHTVISDTKAFSSGTLNTGVSFRFQFNTPGTFSYHCSIHLSMHGTVTVT